VSLSKHFTPTKLSDNIHETPEGFLLCVGVPVTRTGELTYGEGETPLDTDATGKILIYRDAQDVFHADTIASFEGKAVTINHPEDFVSPDNWSYLAKGVVQNVRRGEGQDKDCLVADLLITDATAIMLVKNGLREVSCGYEAEYTQMGVGKGKQKKIIGNHIALVERGRAGRDFRINDHEGKVTRMSKLKEKLLAAFGKTVDEAMKDEEATPPAKKDDAKAKDDGTDLAAIMTMLKELTDKVAAMSGEKKPDAPAADDKDKKDAAPAKKDDSKKDAPPAKKDDADKADGKDDGEEEPAKEMSMAEVSEAIKTLQTSMNKILEKLGEDDSDEDESDESEDDDFEESGMTGDSETLSRAEILAPGIEKSKDIKANALKAAYATKEGKEVIHSLNGGKAPAYDSAEKINTLFTASAELLKAKRNKQLSNTKKVTDGDLEEHAGTVMTPAMINAANKARYGQK
jgi:hypothetical protein